MGILSEEAKKEMLELAASEEFRQDCRRLRENMHNPFIVNGEVDVDRVVEFLTEVNAFMNHPMKPFRKIIDRDMKL